MNDVQTRTFANSDERPEDHEYKLTIEEAADLYMLAGHSRSPRALQKYCAVSKLDCRKVETELGEKYLVAPYSVKRHIAYIEEITPAKKHEQTRTDADIRDNSRTDANIRPLENESEQLRTENANDGERPRTVADIRERSSSNSTANDFSILITLTSNASKQMLTNSKENMNAKSDEPKTYWKMQISELIELQQANAISQSETLAKYMLRLQGIGKPDENPRNISSDDKN